MSGYEEVVVGKGSAGKVFPVIGETTDGLGEYLLREGKLKTFADYERVRRDALAIVRRCRPFGDPDGTTTGLVVGYVQSGKTMSMTAVAALARDNGCRVIILLAGVTTNLLRQNADRFKAHLRAASQGRGSVWRIYNSGDGFGALERQQLKQAVAEWRDPRFAEVDRQTFLYMVLKNHTHLNAMQKLLSDIDMRSVPALVLDDEADQAGLNTSPSDPDGSTTYRRIRTIRQCLPHHTYLQYTATPQAPLLIALDDMLSPAFAELVEPGDGYTGGSSFFGANAHEALVTKLPDDDLFKPGTPPDEAPEFLLRALRVFFVGAAIASERGGPVPRSMLVHPSQRTSDHRRYVEWISGAIDRWNHALRLENDAEHDDVVADFREAYDELRKTAVDSPPLERLLQRLHVSLGRVVVKEVNSEDGSEVDWSNADDYILVGGEKLNRGFTVEGLTVTYMPRNAGGWNADTVQQRARFFGYKAGYLDLCRLYLHPDVVDAYRSYVNHEENVRGQLAKHRGQPLRHWKRSFFLDSQLRPTRQNILSDSYFRVSSDRPWFVPRYPHDNADAISRNRSIVSAFETALGLDAPGDRIFGHRAVSVPLEEVYRALLLEVDVGGRDVVGWYGIMVIVADILDGNPASSCLVIRMSGTRKRTPEGGAITLHQGRSSAEGPGAYPGDAAVREDHRVSVQIHWLEVSGLGREGVPAIAVHVPSALRRDDVLVQPGKR